MKYVVEALALISLGSIAATVVVLMFGKPSLKLADGELRCEGAGAVIINVGGEDYAVNTLAGWQYPPIQLIWNKDTFPETNTDALDLIGTEDWPRANG